MINTPCLDCTYLSGRKGSYKCLSVAIDSDLDNEIALGWRDDLPDCPYFLKRQKEDEIHLDSEELVVVKARYRARRKRDYVIPLKYNIDQEATRKEVLLIVIEFNRKRKSWPSLVQILELSRFRSKSYVWKILKDLLENNELEITTQTSSSKFRVGYGVPKFT